MERLNTNVLIIGKSGVGKSSLLNYLFGKEIQETGCGRPVTKGPLEGEKGIYAFKYQYDESFEVGIYDTWGLEPDKSEIWTKLIIDEVREHEKQEICDWFNTILFCIDANRLVEDFEIQMIERLLNEKNNIVVVLTHCDCEEGNQQSCIMRKRLLDKTSISETNIVYACSVEKELLSGDTVKPFGRTKIFTAIIQNLWKSLRNKVPYQMEQRLVEAFKAFKTAICNYIDSEFLLIRTEKKYDEITNHIDAQFNSFFTQIYNKMNKQIEDAIDYYNKLSEKYAYIALLDWSKLKFGIAKIKSDSIFKDEINGVIKKLEENKNGLMKALLEFKEGRVKDNIKGLLKWTKKYISAPTKVKRELKRLVEKHMSQACGLVESEIKRIQGQLEKLDIERISESQIGAME